MESLIEDLITAGGSVSPWLAVALVAMLPVVELRGAIPLGAAMGLQPLGVFTVAVAANLVPVPLILFAFDGVSRFLRTRLGMQRAVDWVYRRTRARAGTVRRYGWFGLALLVAVPLPTTGVWTASLVASLLGYPLRPALGAILTGTVVAGVIVLFLTIMGMTTFPQG